MAEHIEYRITPFNPRAHLFRVVLTIQNPHPGGQRLALPAWIPGSYMIRDFARNIVSIQASSGQQTVELTKLDKHSWQAAPVKGALVVTCEIYAWDLSVRGAHLDTTHGFFNGTSVFLRVLGQESVPVRVRMEPPPEDISPDWKLATSMPVVQRDERGFGTYEAPDYEHLVDYPVEMGRFRELNFHAAGVAHRMVLSGRLTALDEQRLKDDLAAICEHHARFFGELPIERYLFLTMVTGDGYGGLEHLDSTALMCKRDDLPFPGMKAVSKGYRNFLGLCSHEYFHLWNVKRIRPQILKAADLSGEVHTRLLWAFEGITSYYDDLALVRSGCIEADSYLELLATTVTRVMRGQGRLRQSVAESSFDAWTRFYKQDENAPNAIVSYYSKGALVALGLDVTLRQVTADRLGLDDFMRRLWREFGKTNRGVEEDDLERLAATMAGQDLGDFFRRTVHGTEELPLASWFGYLGIGYRLRPARDLEDWGSSGHSPEKDAPRHALGARYRQKGDFVELTQVHDRGAAQASGLSAGDRLVAMGGVQVTAAGLQALLDRQPPGQDVEIHAFRRDELMVFRLPLQPAEADTCELWLLPDKACSPECLERRRQWLGQ